MSWLDDYRQIWRQQKQEILARKEAERRRAAETAPIYAQYRNLFEAEFIRLTPMVTRLLHDIGDAYWGESKYQNIKYQFDNYNHDLWGWQVGAASLKHGYVSCWKVRLRTSPTEGEFVQQPDQMLRFFFSVSSKLKPPSMLTTHDVSEEQLKEALKNAILYGPAEVDDYDPL